MCSSERCPLSDVLLYGRCISDKIEKVNLKYKKNIFGTENFYKTLFLFQTFLKVVVVYDGIKMFLVMEGIKKIYRCFKII